MGVGMAVIRKDGTARIRIIAPGWGSSGYYSPEVLKRDGPKVFKAHTKSYWDHPTRTEEAERPERSLRDLAGELTTDATWQERGPAGPGLYADMEVFGTYRTALEELAPHIGMSIRAVGRAKSGEIEGQVGKVIEEIVAVRSIDAVTQPGAGGQILQLFESARQAPKVKEGLVDEQEATALREANAKLTSDLAESNTERSRLQEVLMLREARDIVCETLSKIELNDLTRARLVEALASKPAFKDGKIDKVKYVEAIKAAATAELTYLAEVHGSGGIQGMGLSGSDSARGRADLKAALVAAGLSEAAAEIAAKGR